MNTYPIAKGARALCLTLLCCFSSISGAQQDDDSNPQLEALLLQLDQLQTELNDYRDQFSASQRTLQQQELALASNHREVYDAEQAMQASELLLEQLQTQGQNLQQQRLQQQQKLQLELVSAYQNGSQEPLKLILNQEDPTEVNRLMHYYRVLLEKRQNTIDSYLETLAELAQNEKSQQAETELQSALIAELRQAQNALQLRYTERQKTLEDLESSIASTEQQIALRQADRERLERLVESISTGMAELSIANNQLSFSDSKGTCSWPTGGRITANFGTVRAGSVRWNGVMISSQMGNTVSSVHAGRVVFADYLRGYGLLVIIDHDQGYLTLYGHNQSLLVAAGDWVQTGANIARVGNSGGLREPGLYFEIRKDGDPTNPTHWCG